MVWWGGGLGVVWWGGMGYWSRCGGVEFGVYGGGGGF